MGNGWRVDGMCLGAVGVRQHRWFGRKTLLSRTGGGCQDRSRKDGCVYGGRQRDRGKEIADGKGRRMGLWGRCRCRCGLEGREGARVVEERETRTTLEFQGLPLRFHGERARKPAGSRAARRRGNQTRRTSRAEPRSSETSGEGQGNRLRMTHSDTDMKLQRKQRNAAVRGRGRAQPEKIRERTLKHQYTLRTAAEHNQNSDNTREQRSADRTCAAAVVRIVTVRF
jgi:hypothetical protein